MFSTVLEYCHQNQTIWRNRQVKNNNNGSVLHENQDESEVVVTIEVCPFNVLINEPSHVLHSFRVLSQEPDNMVDPSGEKQQHNTCDMRTKLKVRLL